MSKTTKESKKADGEREEKEEVESSMCSLVNRKLAAPWWRVNHVQQVVAQQGETNLSCSGPQQKLKTLWSSTNAANARELII